MPMNKVKRTFFFSGKVQRKIKVTVFRLHITSVWPTLQSNRFTGYEALFLQYINHAKLYSPYSIFTLKTLQKLQFASQNSSSFSHKC